VADEIVHRPETLVRAACLAAEQRVGAVRGGSRDFQGPGGGHRRDELVSIAVRGGLARAGDRDAVGISRIGERSELPVCLLFKLLVGNGNEGVRPGPCGYKALCDFLRFAARR